MRTFFITASFFLVPLVASAGTIGQVVNTIGTIINAAIPVLVALALAFFFWGLALYILSAGNEEKKDQGKSIMIWGVIALFVMVSVWGLVGLIATTFNIQQGGTVTPPTVGGSGF